MSRCKDCIHDDVCSALIKDGLPWDDGKYPAEAFCWAFRNKSDVVEIRHGEWETIPDYSRSLPTYRHICSVCKTTYKDIRSHGHNYCHVCGAKMDEKDTEAHNGRSD